MKKSSSGGGEYKRSLLRNGIVLLTERAKFFQTVVVGVWVRAGSRSETAENAGIAHFLEHMLFKGTSKRTALEIARAVDLVGGDFNAMTAREYTCFHITLPVSELNFALDLLTEILLDSQFDEDEIERERKVVLQEMLSSEENPEEFIYDEMMERIFPKHPLGRNITGTKKTVEKFKRKTLVDFFHSHYHPQNIFITVAGDIHHSDVKRVLEKKLGNFRAQEKKSYANKKSGVPKFQPGIAVVERDWEQAHLMMSYPSYPVMDERRYAAFLLSGFLGGGMSSQLFQAIREQRGLAYTVYSSISPFRDTGIFSIYLATGMKMIKECAEILKIEINKLQTKLLSSEDLLITKNSLKSTILLSSDSMESRMMALAKSELYMDRHMSIEEACRAIDTVDASMIRDVARDLFSRDPNILLLGKSSNRELKRVFQ